jgi:hypothetical protein
VQKAQLLWHWISSTWQKIGCGSESHQNPSSHPENIMAFWDSSKISSKILPSQIKKKCTFWGSDGDVPPELGHLPGVDHRIRYAGAQGQATV